jgi:hypothetical protein
MPTSRSKPPNGGDDRRAIVWLSVSHPLSRISLAPLRRHSTGYGPPANLLVWYPFDPTARARGLRGSSPALSRSST